MLLPLYLAVVKKTKKERSHWVHPSKERYLNEYISRKYPNPPAGLKQFPVIICMHGFGSSPYEWEEFAEVAQERGCLISNIFLGSHDTLENFAESTWESWLTSLQEEYSRLVSIGYENISISASSTGATLLIHALKMQLFAPSLPLRNIIMVDPLLDINKDLIHKLPYLHSFLFDQPVPTTFQEKGNWIPKRPMSSLVELLRLINRTKALLKTNFSIPKHISITLYNSTNDPIIKKNSAETIIESFYKNYQKKIDHVQIDSSLHVFSRLKGRHNIEIKDLKNQKLFFDTVLEKIKPNSK